MEWWNSHMPENLMCPAMSGMALQMLSHLQKAIITEASHPACFQKKKKENGDYNKIKKVKIHLDFLPSGNKINSLLAQKKENCYWVICNLHRPNLVNPFVTQEVGTKVSIVVSWVEILA